MRNIYKEKDPLKNRNIEIIYLICLQFEYSSIYNYFQHFSFNNRVNDNELIVSIINQENEDIIFGSDKEENDEYLIYNKMIDSISKEKVLDNVNIRYELSKVFDLFKQLFIKDGKVKKSFYDLINLSLNITYIDDQNKSNEQSMGRYVRETILDLILPMSEIKELTEKNRSSELFNAPFPIFKIVSNLSEDQIENERYILAEGGKKYARYYKNPIQITTEEGEVVDLLLINHWGHSQKEMYINWFNKWKNKSKNYRNMLYNRGYVSTLTSKKFWTIFKNDYELLNTNINKEFNLEILIKMVLEKFIYKSQNVVSAVTYLQLTRYTKQIDMGVFENEKLLAVLEFKVIKNIDMMKSIGEEYFSSIESRIEFKYGIITSGLTWIFFVKSETSNLFEIEDVIVLGSYLEDDNIEWVEDFEEPSNKLEKKLANLK